MFSSRSGPIPHLHQVRPVRARVHNYLLGGNENYQHDRAAADMLTGRCGTLKERLSVERAFQHASAADLARGDGVRQFLELDVGYPGWNLHHAVAGGRLRDRDGTLPRVVYVAGDPTVAAHGRALLVDSGCPDHERVTDLVETDPTDIVSVVNQAREFLDFRAPIAVSLCGLLAFHATPARLVSELTAVLAAGSFLVVTHATTDTAPEVMAELTKGYNAFLHTDFHPRHSSEVEALFAGCEVAGGELRTPDDWDPSIDDGPTAQARDLHAYGLIARVPGGAV